MPYPTPNIANALAVNTPIANTLLDYLDDYALDLHHDLQRDVLRLTLQALMEQEVTQNINAGHYERIEHRKTYRNGYRESRLHTHLGEITLYIPKLRRGTYNPQFLSQVAKSIRPLALSTFTHQLNPADLHRFCERLGLPALPAYETTSLMARLYHVAQRHRQSRLDTRRFTGLRLDTLKLSADELLIIAAGITKHDEVEVVDYYRINSSEREGWTPFIDHLNQRGAAHLRTIYATSPYLLNTLVRLARWDADYQLIDPNPNHAMPLPQNMLYLWAETPQKAFDFAGIRPSPMFSCVLSAA